MPEGIHPKNNVQTNWTNALAGDKNVTPAEARAIVAAAVKGGIGFDDMIFASYLLKTAALAEASGTPEWGQPYDFSGTDSIASARTIADEIQKREPGLTARVYNALAKKSPALATAGKPLIWLYGKLLGE